MPTDPSDISPASQALTIDEAACSGCVVCLKACPSKAIRVRRGLAQIIPELCVGCGVCYRVCPRGAVKPQTSPLREIERYPLSVAVPNPALFAQFGYDVSPNQVLLGLKAIGFQEVVDTAWLAEMTAGAMEEYLLAHPELRPGISPSCPAVVRLITKRFPGLVGNVIPILPPWLMAAKGFKTRLADRRGWDPSQVGVFIISPGTSRIKALETSLSEEHTYVDGIISFAEVYGPLLKAIKNLDPDDMLQKASGAGLAWATTGGQARSVDVDYTLAVSGFDEVVNILEMLEAGRLRELRFVEAQICSKGCVGGPLAVENRYRAASVTQRLIRRYGPHSRVNRAKIREMMGEGMFDWEIELRPHPLAPLAPEPREAIRRMRAIKALTERLPLSECGICGSPDCETFAEDVVRGWAQENDCPMLMAQKGHGGPARPAGDTLG
ncbi:MAG: 4Fe-4S binding protein [Deltaproteobacteria bacterium]|nr:4Fe-4S binding protein [Deltaproteobacteria bacterium]